MQVHDRDVDVAEAGQRVAVSLPGVERTALRRGNALVEPGAYSVSYRLDVSLDELRPVANAARVHVHLGTAEIPATVRRLGDGFAQLRLSSPVVAARGDRVILRSETTVAGGRVVDPAPPHRTSEERIAAIDRGDAAALVFAPVLRTSLDVDDDALAGLERAGDWVFSAAWLAELREELDRRLDAASPLDPGVPAPVDPWAADVVPLLGLERREGKLYRPGSTRSLDGRELEAAELEAKLGLEPVKVDDPALARFLEEEGRLVRVGNGLAISDSGLRRGEREARRRVSHRGRHHARALPRPARCREADGRAPARALRRRRHHPANRRSAHPAPVGTRGLMRGWLPVALVVLGIAAFLTYGSLRGPRSRAHIDPSSRPDFAPGVVDTVSDGDTIHLVGRTPRATRADRRAGDRGGGVLREGGRRPRSRSSRLSAAP